MIIFKFYPDTNTEQSQAIPEDVDYDDLYDETEDLIDKQIENLSQLEKLENSSINPNDILDMCYQLIPLQKVHKEIITTLNIIEREIDTIDLKRSLQPLEKHIYNLEKTVQTSNQMVYLFDKIKKSRKRARRIAKKSARISSLEDLSKLENMTEQLLDQSDFPTQMEYYSNQQIDISGLEHEYNKMLKQFDKTVEALDEMNVKLRSSI